MENPHMWEYWLEKRGSPSEALEADYPNLLKSDPHLQIAIQQIKYNQAMIDNIMKQLAGRGEDGDGLSVIQRYLS